LESLQLICDIAYSKIVGDVSISRLKRFGMCRSDKDYLEIICDLCAGFFIGCSTAFGVLNLSLLMGFLVNSIKILLKKISHSFGIGTFIIIAVAADYFLDIRV
jgi:hypothetical protein